MTAAENPSRYARHFSGDALKAKLARVRHLTRLARTAADLYRLVTARGAPTSVRLAAAGALGYLILPVDAVPDFTPMIGYADDIGVIIVTATTLAGHLAQLRQRAVG